jgi:hypothetical protein
MTDPAIIYWVLVGQTPVPEPDFMAWAVWYRTADRVVRQTEIPGGMVSTVFLGLDHNFGGGPPILFETMIFCDGEGSGECWRCSTWLEAEQQHVAALAMVAE